MEIALRKCPVQGRYSGQADKLRVYVIGVAAKINRGIKFSVQGYA